MKSDYRVLEHPRVLQPPLATSFVRQDLADYIASAAQSVLDARAALFPEATLADADPPLFAMPPALYVKARQRLDRAVDAACSGQETRAGRKGQELTTGLGGRLPVRGAQTLTSLLPPDKPRKKARNEEGASTLPS